MNVAVIQHRRGALEILKVPAVFRRKDAMFMRLEHPFQTTSVAGRFEWLLR